MSDYRKDTYPVFEMFRKQWALAAAGTMEKYDACTIGWGSLGTLWTRDASSGQIITVYVHPARYTQQFLKGSNRFTVSFFAPEYKKALAYMGTHSGREEDKTEKCGLTPVEVDGTVGFAQAERIFVCRKLYQHPFAKEDLSEEIREYYQNDPESFPVGENNEWQPHWMFIGEIIDVIDHRKPAE